MPYPATTHAARHALVASLVALTLPAIVNRSGNLRGRVM
jgi:hypothetical protein